MRRSWGVVMATCAASGLLLTALAPKRWGITPVDGLLIGLAICAWVLRGYGDRRMEGARLGDPRMWLGLGARAALFGLLWWTQAALFFDLMPGTDVRRGFVTLSAWVVAQALLGGGAPRRKKAPAAGR